MLRPKVNDVVEVEFLDHHEAADDPAVFVVYGRLSRMDDISLTVQTWTFPDKEPVQEEQMHNVHRFTLIRSCITRIEVLKRS